jgi:hypothetical protein
MFWNKNSPINSDNTKLLIEILPSGECMIVTNVSRRDKPEVLSIIINLLLSNHRDMVNGLTESVKDWSNKNGWSDKGNIVIDQILQVQNKLKENTNQTNPAVKQNRNPMIKPTHVLPLLTSKMGQITD